MKALQRKSNNIPETAIFVFVAAVFIFWRVNNYKDNGSPIQKQKIIAHAADYMHQTHPDIADKVKMNTDSIPYMENGSRQYPFPHWRIYFFEQNGDICFDLIYDDEKNLISDGYETWYLAGGKAYLDRSYEYAGQLNKLKLNNGEKPLEISGMFYLTQDYALAMADYDAYYACADYTGPQLPPGRKRDVHQLARTQGYIRVNMWHGYGDTSQFAAMVTDAIAQLKENNISWHSARFAWWCGEEKAVDSFYILNISYEQRYSTDLQKYIAENTDYTDEEEIKKAP